jgi:hypothetical protein
VRRDLRLGVFNATVAAGMLRGAASLTGLVDGATEEIESGVPGLKALAVRRPAGVASAWRRGTRR